MSIKNRHICLFTERSDSNYFHAIVQLFLKFWLQLKYSLCILDRADNIALYRIEGEKKERTNEYSIEGWRKIWGEEAMKKKKDLRWSYKKKYMEYRFCFVIFRTQGACCLVDDRIPVWDNWLGFLWWCWEIYKMFN